MSESDGLDEAVEAMLRTGLMTAGRIGEQLARDREQKMRASQAGEERQARELQARLDAERAAARAQLAPALDNRWWDTASERDIVRAHETATAWKAHDPMAASAVESIREQVQRRYGMDVSSLGAAGPATQAGADGLTGQGTGERGAAAGGRTQAAALLAEAGRDDRARKQGVQSENATRESSGSDAGLQYDSSARRGALAKRLDGVADKEAVTARLSADSDQGTPPAAAVTAAHAKAPKARKTRGAPGATRQAQKGLSR